MRDNKIEGDTEDIYKILTQFNDLRVISIGSNPILKNIPNYWRKTIAMIKSLTCLEERPIKFEERRLAE